MYFQICISPSIPKVKPLNEISFLTYFSRVRRDVLEGTWDEMLDDMDANIELEKRAAGNETDSRYKRQAEIPDIPNQDNTKYDVQELTKYHVRLSQSSQGRCVWVQSGDNHTVLGK